ncbi:hypothetical protein CSOJ01_08862 [Colletotrichum sojae]|uniref:Uncharacterized protein n=1 Tax=Colletotrichum sojae TaxID=2175907 RepID=A0A8H6J4L4_9PEZI|nr:hypothetical protein CSOJ01_08862 [Colletotrichum sojae]
MSALRATRVRSLLRPAAFRPVQQHRIAPRRSYAIKQTPRDTRTYHGGDQPAPAGSSEPIPTRPGEVKNRATLYAIGGVAIALGAFFAFLTGSPDKAAGVADATSRSGGTPLFSGPLSGKEGGERRLEATTGRDPNRRTGLAGIKSDATDPNQGRGRN